MHLVAAQSSCLALQTPRLPRSSQQPAVYEHDSTCPTAQQLTGWTERLRSTQRPARPQPQFPSEGPAARRGCWTRLTMAQTSRRPPLRPHRYQTPIRAPRRRSAFRRHRRPVERPHLPAPAQLHRTAWRTRRRGTPAPTHRPRSAARRRRGETARPAAGTAIPSTA